VAHVEWGPVAVWVGALASSLAVIVALLGGSGWFTRRHQPLLGLSFEDRQPWCRRVPPHVSGDGEMLWVRIAVQNHGVHPAKSCIGRLTGLASNGTERSDIDPVQLRWAGVPRSRSFEPVDLRRGQTDFLNVVYLPVGQDWLIDTFGIDFDPGFETHLRSDQVHQLQIAVFADNANTNSLSLRLEIGPDGPRISRA
jgi:hypothetical protein